MEMIQSVAAMMAEDPYKLLIVDSITANLRVDFSGRGELAERQQRLGQMMSRLKKVRQAPVQLLSSQLRSLEILICCLQLLYSFCCSVSMLLEAWHLMLQLFCFCKHFLDS